MTRLIAPALLGLLSISPVQAVAETQFILAGRLLDVETGEYQTHRLLQIEDGLIARVADAAGWEDFSGLIDLSDYTVLPGLMDMHTHLCDSTYKGYEEFDPWAEPAASWGIAGTVHAKQVLQAGFTTVRDVSTPYYADVALRDAIERGWIEGPRMFVSAAMITMTGGHGHWGNWIASQH